ncbi:MAG: hypothetical protein ACR2FY_01035 [Pirellulaceae bacterium]
MKTGQMLFVAFGGMLLGAAGTLALQTGLFHYEVTLDIRPRGPLTVPPPNLQASTSDPYIGPPLAHNWEPSPYSVESLPATMPPLDDQQVAEIVSLREQIGPTVSQKLIDLTSSQGNSGGESFADHLRSAAGVSDSAPLPVEQAASQPAPLADGSLARGLQEAQLR